MSSQVRGGGGPEIGLRLKIQKKTKNKHKQFCSDQNELYDTTVFYFYFIIFQNVTQKMKLKLVIPSDAESVATGLCTRKEQRDVSFLFADLCGRDIVWWQCEDFKS